MQPYLIHRMRLVLGGIGWVIVFLVILGTLEVIGCRVLTRRLEKGGKGTLTEEKQAKLLQGKKYNSRER